MFINLWGWIIHSYHGSPLYNLFIFRWKKTTSGHVIIPIDIFFNQADKWFKVVILNKEEHINYLVHRCQCVKTCRDCGTPFRDSTRGCVKPTSREIKEYGPLC